MEINAVVVLSKYIHLSESKSCPNKFQIRGVQTNYLIKESKRRKKV